MLFYPAPAKLNLFLHITGKRSDGYHLLESLVAFTEFGDRLTFEAADEITLSISGEFTESLKPSPLEGEGRMGGKSHAVTPHPNPPPQGGRENLVIKAAHLLQSASGVTSGAHISLEKNIPVGAGLGGGSSDAAAAIHGLCTLWNLQPDVAQLGKIALQLGSDVPACLYGSPAMLHGIGEQITPVSLAAEVWCVLVNPGVPLLTSEVYRNFDASFAAPQSEPQLYKSPETLIGHLRACENMLEAPAIQLLPVIREIINAIKDTPRCLLARMSGSGATCFGLYDSQHAAEAALALLRARHSSWWMVATPIRKEHHDEA